MIGGLLNAMRAQASMAGNGRAAVRIGIVSSYDHENYCAKVLIQPDNDETGWLPVVSPWVGNGWGMFAPVTPGDVVEVQFQEDDFNVGFVCQRFFNDGIRPLDVESGEFWLVHKSGSFVKLTNDGKLLINGHVEIDATAPTINITATASIAITAPSIALNGNITLNGPVTQGKGSNGGDMQLQGPMHVINQISSDTDVIAAGKSGAHHKHSDPQGGSVGEPT